MVAKIKSGKSLIGALSYNENKVKSGKAMLLVTSGYTKSDDALSFHDKLFRLTDLAERNLRTKTNTLHLSLNFDVNEMLETDKLVDIGSDYMKRIGFENQPYLIYHHLDAGHPHIHIVTTNIQADGKRISLNNIGLSKSEPARKEIEIAYGLVKASEKTKNIDQTDNLKIIPAKYGETDTKRSISNIVNEVAKSFKYTSLPELNAILNLYNIVADKGSKESVMFKNGGLNYWITDESGRKTGVPIKASSIYQKPTLKLLEKRFKLNEYLRKPLKEQLKSKIDKVKLQATSMDQFRDQLNKVGVTLVVRQNSEGRIYGLSYIDRNEKVVFNGSDLDKDKSYSAAAVIGNFQFIISGNDSATVEHAFEKNVSAQTGETTTLNQNHGRSLLEELLDPNNPDQVAQSQFGPRKKKKKRRKLNL
ncbi:MAG: relaxase/mobilization nuclease domain-containing protein [Mucilaginibacter sp.]|jgi:hypothetical protein|uniref:relaxase/mobilization nuclease domain-containing protein n=1 Tax=Mucilaginibacter sp. TaxID=1882438 RepID=UPI0035681F3E